MIKATTTFFFLIFALYFIATVEAANNKDYAQNLAAQLSSNSTSYYLALYGSEL